MTDDERQQLADEFEAVRAPALVIGDAASIFKTRTADLEWALMMTDPATAAERRVGFDQGYADRELDTRARWWREARDELRHVLEQHAERVR